MAMLAIPFSLSTGKKGAITGVAVAVGIAVFYTVVSRLFEAMGDLSQLPPALAAWSPDLIFVPGGRIFDSESADVEAGVRRRAFGIVRRRALGVGRQASPLGCREFSEALDSILPKALSHSDCKESPSRSAKSPGLTPNAERP